MGKILWKCSDCALDTSVLYAYDCLGWNLNIDKALISFFDAIFSDNRPFKNQLDFLKKITKQHPFLDFLFEN